jgi:head-tail adaptor
MSIRQLKRRALRKVALGDRRSLITIWERNIAAPTGTAVSVQEEYTNPVQEWAKIDTVSSLAAGQDRFDGVNLRIGASHSHVFIVRHSPDYSAQNIVEWEGDYFDIMETNNPDSRFEDLELYCKSKGDKNLEANK